MFFYLQRVWKGWRFIPRNVRTYYSVARPEGTIKMNVETDLEGEITGGNKEIERIIRKNLCHIQRKRSLLLGN